MVSQAAPMKVCLAVVVGGVIYMLSIHGTLVVHARQYDWAILSHWVIPQWLAVGAGLSICPVVAACERGQRPKTDVVRCVWTACAVHMPYCLSVLWSAHGGHVGLGIAWSGGICIGMVALCKQRRRRQGTADNAGGACAVAYVTLVYLYGVMVGAVLCVAAAAGV